MKALKLVVVPAVLALVGAASMPASAVVAGGALVTNGSPNTPFTQNKQNEPAVAVDANHPLVLAAGANEEIDEEACNAAADNTCPFTPGVGTSGVYFSIDGGKSWTQPIYTGYSARGCLGTPDPDTVDDSCQPAAEGPIGTLPWYSENGLVSDGDPALAFGPQPSSNGHFDWINGSRLYYANLVEDFPGAGSFKGFEAVGVSRTDDVAAAAAGGASGKAAWKPPVLVARQSQTTFSDKEQVWADNVSSSPFFGNVYLCWASFLGQEKSPRAAPAPLQVAVSHDGGDTWTQHQISPAANNGLVNPADGCTVRTDSHGNAFVFGVGRNGQTGHQSFELMSMSSNGGQTWSPAKPILGPVNQPGVFDPAQGRPTIDGIAGARSDLAPAPSVDIANGAPTGADATDRMVISYVSGDLAAPHVFFAESTNSGATWSTPVPIEKSGDRGFYAAPAISPNGTDVYVVYNAFTTPYRNDTTSVRTLIGEFLHATVGASGTGSFGEVNRGAPGDPRGSSANSLTAEFLGDYVYAAATRTYGVSVANDSRNDVDCPAIDTWRQANITDPASAGRKPAPEQECPATFGNSDIFAYTTAP
jgi:hypothetical protein